MVSCIIEGRRNNVFLTVVKNEYKEVIVSRSIGSTGCVNYKKKTVYGAELLGKTIGNYLLSLNILEVKVFLTGTYKRQERGCLNGLRKSNIKINYFQYMLNYAHNGVKFSKKRRKRSKKR